MHSWSVSIECVPYVRGERKPSIGSLDRKSLAKKKRLSDTSWVVPGCILKGCLGSRAGIIDGRTHNDSSSINITSKYIWINSLRMHNRVPRWPSQPFAGLPSVTCWKDDSLKTAKPAKLQYDKMSKLHRPCRDNEDILSSDVSFVDCILIGV